MIVPYGLWVVLGKDGLSTGSVYESIEKARRACDELNVGIPGLFGVGERAPYVVQLYLRAPEEK